MRKVFFSFCFDSDVHRTWQIRNSEKFKIKKEDRGFIDAAESESLSKKGDKVIKKWIDEQMEGTSVTVVLIGSETANSRWVRYEIEQSNKKIKGILGVYIHNVKNLEGRTSYKGKNPFYGIDFLKIYGDNGIPCYDWSEDDGYENLSDWIEKAANQVGR